MRITRKVLIIPKNIMVENILESGFIYESIHNIIKIQYIASIFHTLPDFIFWYIWSRKSIILDSDVWQQRTRNKTVCYAAQAVS